MLYAILSRLVFYLRVSEIHDRSCSRDREGQVIFYPSTSDAAGRAWSLVLFSAVAQELEASSTWCGGIERKEVQGLKCDGFCGDGSEVEATRVRMVVTSSQQ